ncbi:MAG: HAD-IA family hydrolase [Solobacterium sp.]|nr:HAD-IA family hydrolase [Solobacterium sp.]
MNRAFIWDLDGTLLDSYKVIVPSLYEAFREAGLDLDQEEIHREVIYTSVSSCIRRISAETGIAYDTVHKRFTELRVQRDQELRLNPGAHETLAILADNGAKHCLYTHSGRSTESVLARLGVSGFFEEIVTKEYGFARKPVPDAVNYLIDKYGLDRERTFYVGDRTIDMDCAVNAGIRGILYLPEGNPCIPNGAESWTVHDLLEITGLDSDQQKPQDHRLHADMR